MQVLQVIAEYFPPRGNSCGGTQVHLRDLAAGLQARGHEVEIFTALRGGDFDEYLTTEIEWEGVRVSRVTNNLDDVERFEMLYASPKLDSRFRAFLYDKKPDLVHFHHLTRLSTTLIEICHEAGLPVVLTLHDYWLVCPRGKRFHPITEENCEELDRVRCVQCLNPMWPHLLPIGEPDADTDPLGVDAAWYTLRRWDAHIKHVFDLCDLVITPAHFHRERFLEYGVDPERCVVIEHGLETSALRSEPRGRGPIKTIGYLGSIIPPKGVHILVEAFDLLAREDLTLDIHGQIEDHSDSGYARRLESSAGLRVKLHGAYEPAELPELLASFDVLVVPSIWWETFGLTAREGALAGLPVVVADTGGLHDAVASGMALGFEAGNAQDLARVLARLLEDADLRDEMSRKAHLVRDIADCVAETEGQYTEMLARVAAQR